MWTIILAKIKKHWIKTMQNWGKWSKNIPPFQVFMFHLPIIKLILSYIHFIYKLIYPFTPQNQTHSSNTKITAQSQLFGWKFQIILLKIWSNWHFFICYKQSVLLHEKWDFIIETKSTNRLTFYRSLRRSTRLYERQ